jgi:tetratricopeptide (TPR) repeat protein
MATGSSNSSEFHFTTRQDEFDELLMKAYTLYRDGKHEEALAICKKAMEMRPDDNRPWAIAGVVYMGQRKMQEASDALAVAIRLSPGNPVLHYTKARADRFRNAREEGLASVRKAIELKPDYAEAYLLLGDLLGVGKGNEGESAAAYRKAIELDPKLLDAYKYLGNRLEGQKDERGAEEAYRTAMQADPKKASGRTDLGRLLVKQGRLAEARELWNGRTTDEDRTFPNFITVLERAEKLEAAKQAYAKNPNDAEANLQIGLATMEGDHWVVDGRQERAIEYFKKALEIKPDFAKAQHAICKAYVQMADTFKAKNKELDEELAKLRKMDPKLADEIVEYRKTYSGGFKVAAPSPTKRQ